MPLIPPPTLSLLVLRPVTLTLMQSGEESRGTQGKLREAIHTHSLSPAPVIPAKAGIQPSPFVPLPLGPSCGRMARGRGKKKKEGLSPLLDCLLTKSLTMTMIFVCLNIRKQTLLFLHYDLSETILMQQQRR